MNRKIPLFSIIIPTFNRPRQLGECLRGISKQDYPFHLFEVIVVDDGGKYPLEPIVQRFLNHLEVTLIIQDNAGPAAARNRGADDARGDLLVFTDDDCYPSMDWLNNLSARFAIRNECAISGRTINLASHNPFAEASQLIVDFFHDTHNAEPEQAKFWTSNNLAVPKKGFRAANGFDTTYQKAGGEDRDLCDRWRHHGFSIIFAPEVLVYHSHIMGLSAFIRQHCNYGSGAFHFHRKHRARWNRRVSMEPLSYLKLVGYPFLKSKIRRKLTLTLLLLISQAANAFGYFREGWRDRDKTWDSISQ